MLRSALRYPTREDWVPTLLVGGGLHLLSVYVPVIPLVFVAGYLIRVLGGTDSVAADEGNGDGVALPRFDAPLDLLRRGVAATVIAAVYLVVPTAVLALTVQGIASGGISGTSESAVGVVLGGTASLALACLFVYPLPAALVGYARTGRLRAAFDRAQLLDTVRSGRYFFAVVVAAVFTALVGALAVVLSRVAVGFFLAFYVELVAAALVSTGTPRNE